MKNIVPSLRRIREERRLVSPRGQVQRMGYLGRQVLFLITHPEDHIQRHHLAGRFYEERELALIQRHFPLGGVFLDLGANVGNHGLFAALFLNARLVIPVEPNPVAHDTLIANVFLNQLEGRFDLDRLGLGVSDRDSGGARIRFDRRNIGAGRIEADPAPQDPDAASEGITLVPADRIVDGRRIDFVKIDVEGMEMAVLAGLSETLARCRPPIFVEVDDANAPAFHDWVAAQGYRIAARTRRYPGNENFMILPLPGPDQAAGEAGGAAGPAGSG